MAAQQQPRASLIFLDSKSAALLEILKPRIIEKRRDIIEAILSDFDGTSFKISADQGGSVAQLSMKILGATELKRLGAPERIDALFPGMIRSPEDGFDITLSFDCDNLAIPAEEFLSSICDLKYHFLGAPLYSVLTTLSCGQSVDAPLVQIQYRQKESIFISQSTSKVIVIFSIHFEDPTDKTLAEQFLQQFHESQRENSGAPPVSYTKDPPSELLSNGISPINFTHNPDGCGYLLFALESRHVSGEKKDRAVKLLISFRTYLHYHVKSTKTHLHSRIRKKVGSWIQVINRAVPESDSAAAADKKTATGKTFLRK